MINPLITEWTHDTYDYSQGNQVVSHTMSIRYENVKYYSGNIGGDTPSEQVTGFADPSHYDIEKSPIAVPGSTYVPTGSKQDLQALATGQNTLQNVVGAVGQSLALTASPFATAALAGSGAIGAALSVGLGIATRNGAIVPQQTPGSQGGQLFPTPAGVDVATKINNLNVGG